MAIVRLRVSYCPSIILEKEIENDEELPSALKELMDHRDKILLGLK